MTTQLQYTHLIFIKVHLKRKKDELSKLKFSISIKSNPIQQSQGTSNIWSNSRQLSIHPSIFYTVNPSVGSRGGWSLSQQSSGERRGKTIIMQLIIIQCVALCPPNCPSGINKVFSDSDTITFQKSKSNSNPNESKSCVAKEANGLHLNFSLHKVTVEVGSCCSELS